MSASREKKNRQEKAAQGYVDPKVIREAEEKAAQKKSKIIYGIIAAVFVIVAIGSWLISSGVLERNAKAIAIDGEEFTAVFLTNAVGTSFVKVSRPLTLSGLHTLKTANGNQVILVSDSGITLSGVSTFSSLKGGRHYVDFSSGGNGRFGLSDTCELNGRVNVGELVLANNIADFRLDHFASSSNPVRTDDLVLDSIYRGSGHFYVVGPRGSDAHEGTWNVTPGSPYIFSAGTGGTVAPGSVVACDGVFPEGTLERFKCIRERKRILGEKRTPCRMIARGFQCALNGM